MDKAKSGMYSDTTVKTARRTYRSEIETFTPDRAQQMLTTCRYERQRAVRAHHVTALAEAMQRGVFQLSEIQVYYVGDRGYLINGQHRLHAIIESGIPQVLNVVRVTVDSEEEVAEAYSSFDRPLTRSFSDVYSAHGLSDELGVIPSLLTKAGSAVSVIRAGFQPTISWSARAPDIRVALLRAWADDARAYFSAITAADSLYAKRLEAAGVCAVGLVTFRYRPDLATQFWTSVAGNDGLRRESPEQALIKFLIETKVGTGGVSSAKLSRAVAAAWNASYDRRDLKILKVFDQTAPILIKGTPYNGKQVVRIDHEKPGGA